MRHGDYKWNEDGVPPGQLTVWVDLRTQLLSVFRGGHEIGTAVVVYGAETMESPLGRFPILSKQRDYHSRTYARSEEHTSELQSLMRISYAVFCLTKNTSRQQ